MTTIRARVLLFALIVLFLAAPRGLAQFSDPTADALFRKGQYAKAEPIYRRNLARLEAQHGTNSLELCGTLDDLGMTYLWLQQFDKAEPLLLRSLQIRQSQLGREHRYVGFSCIKLCAFYTALGQYPKAIEYGEQGLRDMETKDNNVDNLIGALNRLALAYWNGGKYDKAEKLFLRELKLDEENSKTSDLALTTQNLALNYVSMRRYDDAEKYYLYSIKVWKSVDPPCHH